MIIINFEQSYLFLLKKIAHLKNVRTFANDKLSAVEKMSRSEKEKIERLARYAKALGHPTRVEILLFLLSQESCFFGDIFDVLPIAKATVSQHLSELKDAGLIQGEIIPPKVKYCINAQNWAEAQSMFNDVFNLYAPKCKCE